MRIAIVAPLVAAIRDPQVGGSQAFVADLARGLVARGHEVHLHAASGSNVTGVEVIDTGVDASALVATRYRAGVSAARASTQVDAAFATVYAAIRSSRYDVVHNHAFDAPAVSLAVGLAAPVVHTLHLPPDDEVVGAIAEARRAKPRPTIACVSDHQRDAWRGLVPVDAVLRPLVPTRSIPFGRTPGSNAIFAGRLSPEKGAAEAIAIARSAGMSIDVFGDAYDAAYVREKIEPQRSASDVTLHGGVSRAELWRAMARAGVVLCPALWDEPFGMAAAEAQACGTPVVGFRRGAIAEVIREGETGFLVGVGAVAAAADAATRTRSLSRARCREHAEAALDIELSLDAHEDLYERVVAAGRAAAVHG